MKTISPGTTRTSREDEFPLGGGEMGALVLDWSKTSLGPISAWPSHLKATIGLMLPAQAQIVLFRVQSSWPCITTPTRRRSVTSIPEHLVGACAGELGRAVGRS